MIHLLLWENYFSQIIRDGMRRVVGLYPLLPNRMSVDRDENGNLVYTYTPMSDSNPNLKSGQSIKLHREDVLHIPGLGFDGLVDYSPIAMVKNAVGMTLACEEYGSSFFANGAHPGGHDSPSYRCIRKRLPNTLRVFTRTCLCKIVNKDGAR